jgi:pyruvate, water dikinase
MGLGFASEYLKGYFEVIFSEISGVVFIDYNRQLVRTADLLNVSSPPPSVSAEIDIVGQCGCSGFARGLARVVGEKDVANASIGSDEILVCRFTSPDFLPLMTRAAAVVTDVGGVLSHAAIVCRALKKPCVIGTRVGTSTIRTGDDIQVDGANGVIRFHRPIR